MHVTNIRASGSACPSDAVTTKIFVQPDYFDTGSYDIRVYGCSDYAITGGPWIPIATKTGWANPLGGAFEISVQVTIPYNVRYSYTIGAKNYSEPNNTTPDITWTVLLPTIKKGSATVSPQSGRAPLTITATYSGGEGISDVVWDFGDGAIVNGRNLTHTYTRAGNYTIYVDVYGRCGNGGDRTYVGTVNVAADTNCHNPEGTNGSYACHGTTRIRCDSGTWVTVENNSPQCGYVPPPPPPQNCSNPYGTPGSYACQGTTRVQCNNGVWTPVEYNSSQCGYTPPPPPPQNCSNPYGTPGSYACQGTTRVRCDNGTWTSVEYNSSQCGYTPPPPPPVRCNNPGGDEGDTICLGVTLMECRNGSWQIKEENSPTCGYTPLPPTPPPPPPPLPPTQCSNPVANEGSTYCFGTTLKECQNGVWVQIEPNSPQCGYTPPPPPPPPPQNCTNPIGENGATYCSGTTLMECRNGTWYPKEYNSTTCGYTPPAPPSGNCTNPAGNAGSTYCDGYTLKKCQNGTWIVQEYLSPSCGYGISPTGCTNPPGNTGDTFCDGTTLKRCNGTAWLVEEYNSDQCASGGFDLANIDTTTLLYAGAGLVAAIGIGSLLGSRKKQKE